MAEGSEVNEHHVQILANLCRICGNRLKKLKETYQTSYECEEFSEFLAKNFQIDVNKDNPAIHPPRFCHTCYRSHLRERMFWEIHTDENCSTCEKDQKIKKGGRPKKPKKGGKRVGKLTVVSESSSGPIRTLLQAKIRSLKSSLTAVRHPEFSERFALVESEKRDFVCPICKEMLDMPIETPCTHFFCADCLLQALEKSDSEPSCPVCQTLLTGEDDLFYNKAYVRLIENQPVCCKKCKKKLEYHLCVSHKCDNDPAPQRPATPEPIPVRTLSEALAELKQGKVADDVARLTYSGVKALMAVSDDGSIARLKGPGKVNSSVKPCHMQCFFPRYFSFSDRVWAALLQIIIIFSTIVIFQSFYL